MSTIHDTMYPRLKQNVSPEDLARVYSPSPEECLFALQQTATPLAYLGFLIALKTFQRLGYFLSIHEVPSTIVTHIATRTDRTAKIDGFLMERWIRLLF